VSDVLNQVRRTIETHGLLTPGDRVVVGVSGGPDSVCLLHVLLRLREQGYRLRIHAASTATNANLDEIRELTTFLYDRCPKIDHHNLAIIRGDRRNPGWAGSLVVGIAQALAILPGISRSGFTVVAALWQKTGREKAAEFSFLLSIPAIVGASLLQLPELGGGAPKTSNPLI